MQEPPIKDYVLNKILPGELNGRNQETPTKGNFFYVSAASHSRFSIQINDKAQFKSSLVRGHIFPEDFQIEKIRVINEDGTGLELNVTVQVGKGQPINHLFNVSADDVTPILRSDYPSLVGEDSRTEAGGTVNTWQKLLDADDYRAEVWLITDAAIGEAFWNTSDPGAAAEYFSRDIKATADTGGFLKLKTTAAIYVRLKANKTIRALTFKFAP